MVQTPDQGMASYARPLMPFWGLDAAQADRRWLRLGHGLEALLFRVAELEHLDEFDAVLAGLPAGALATCHFPMDADYLDDLRVRDRLYAFIDIARRRGARGVVVHSNRLIEVEQLDGVDFDVLRGRYLELFADLDRRLADGGLWLGVENTPLMGDLGDDVDAVFVYPEDFAAFAFESVGITFDFAHWVGTLDTLRGVAEHGVPAGLLPPVRPAELLGFTALRDRIRHLHFGASTGLALPPRRSRASGGAVPSDVRQDELYSRVADVFCRDGLTMSLEITESDYRRRSQIFRALRWLAQRGYVAATDGGDDR